MSNNLTTHAVLIANRSTFVDGNALTDAAIAKIQCQLDVLERCGIRDVCIVESAQADALADKLGLRNSNLRVTVLSNRGWQRASGAALLVAESFIESANGPVLVVPNDRLLDASDLSELMEFLSDTDDAVIAVSVRDDSQASDDDRVQSNMVDRLTDIGEDLDTYDGLFTGHALVRHSICNQLRKYVNPRLAQGVSQLPRVRVKCVSPTWSPSSVDSLKQEVDAILQRKRHPRYKLFNPGPVNTTAGVKSALVHPDVCHRDSDFTELMVSLGSKLRRIYRATTDEHSVVVITGSGSSAMEASITSSVAEDRAILVVDNGAFGERMREICSIHGLKTIHLRYPWGEMVKARDIERKLQKHPEISVVAMVHHETSVGLLNPVTEVGALCRKYDKMFLVDAVSSLGAEEIDVVRDNIDICYASSNKCLHGIAGAAFVCVSNRAWKRLDKIPPRSMYLDLRRYRKYMNELAQTPFTPAVSTYFALNAACDEFLADGHDKRLARYKSLNRQLRQGLRKLGAFALTHTGQESHSIVTCSVPDGVVFEHLYEAMKLRGYIIYGCKSVLAGKFFQVANMGDIDSETVATFLVALEESIEQVKVVQVAPRKRVTRLFSNSEA